jgi:hypothetical protein
MVETLSRSSVFYPARSLYVHTKLLALLLLGAYLLCAALLAWLGVRLSGMHAQTFILSWQELAEVLCWSLVSIALGGCVLVARFLYALRAGVRKGIVEVVGNRELTVRDLSAQNLGSVFWMVGTVAACMTVAVVGLAPISLLNWTLHWPHPVLVVLGTGIVIALGIPGLVLTAMSGAFVVIGWAGGISFCRNLGAPQTYALSAQTTLIIDDCVLTVTSPNLPEALLDLDQLQPDDRRSLLFLLREQSLEAHRPWNPQLGEEIDAVLEETGNAEQSEHYTLVG